MSLPLLFVAALFSAGDLNDTYQHASDQGCYVHKAKAAAQPATRQALINLIPEGWTLCVQPNTVLPDAVRIRKNESWLKNLEHIGAAAGLDFVVDSNHKQVTVSTQTTASQGGIFRS